MSVYYAAVDGDPLTTGNGSYTIAGHAWSTIKDDAGTYRRMIVIGDRAYCSVCRSTGEIDYGVAIRPGGRMNHMGREQAVGGDLVICNCAEKPRIYARYARHKWTILDNGESNSTGQRSTSASSAASLAAVHPSHWIHFTLNESGSCEGLSCVAHFTDGSTERGTVDSNNQIRFTRSNDSACSALELETQGSDAMLGSVTQAILGHSGAL
ncbi:hypothetical protein [Caballeronia sp. J97]|uniref:hypothetical protein n=1 Tax=Caballeronia sp. J97 TaxID=2805429 RepID=UPI002AB11344|nr:hypothetical protein [Caballeronia sp. J97]